MRELRSLLTALRYLPPCTELSLDKIIVPNREKEVVKRRLSALYEGSPEGRQALDASVELLNGMVGDPLSFDALDQRIDRQPGYSGHKRSRHLG